MSHFNGQREGGASTIIDADKVEMQLAVVLIRKLKVEV